MVKIFTLLASPFGSPRPPHATMLGKQAAPIIDWLPKLVGIKQNLCFLSNGH